MSLLRPFRKLYRIVFRRAAIEREMQQEMAAHLTQAAERLERRGLAAQVARETARREFGNIAYLQEEARDARGGRWIETIIRDARFAIRHFVRTPLTAITLILVLALGIGVNAALFSMLQALTMRPAPGVPANDALVRIRGTALSRSDGKLDGRGLSMPEIDDLATRREAFSAVAAFAIDEMMLDMGDGSDPWATTGSFVGPNFFATLGVRPAIGPGLPGRRTDDSPGAELVVVISHRLWEQFGADSAIIGRIVRVNDVPVRIVGVAPTRFKGPVVESTLDLWVPLGARAPLTRSTAYALVSRDSMFLDAIARLTPGTTPEQASAVVRVVASRSAPARPADRAADTTEYAGDVVRLRGLTDVSSDGEAAAIIAMVSTGGLLVLLVACTNVSALLVGAAVARRREIAIRLSLGASRVRVIRQLVTESALGAVAGGALGLALYWGMMRIIATADPGIQPDLGTVAYTAFVALGTGIVFGLSPALHATRLDVASALKDTGGGTSSRSILQRVFIVAQVALTQPLLVGIAMLISIVFSQAGDGNGNPLTQRIVRVQFGLYGGAGSRDEKIARITTVMERVAALPGVEQVVPQSAAFDVGDFRVSKADRGAGPRAEEVVRTQLEGTAPGYFAFQGIRMLRGRELAFADTAGRDMAVVVDVAFARGFWGSADPIGKHLEMTSRGAGRERRNAVVVGVFDTTGTPLRGAGRVYTAAGGRWRKDTYLIRTRGSGAAVIPTIRQLTRELIPDIPIYGNGLATLEQVERLERKEVLRVSATAMAGGILALVLASIGLYGVVALAVRQRNREIGVRVALGARPRQVIGMFFLSGVRLSILGIVLGIPLSAVALYLLTTQFWQNFPLNLPLVAASIAGAVVGVASLASWIPARRAAVVDPLVAMRAE